MPQSRNTNRFLRFRLRTLLVGMLALAMVLAYLSATGRSYRREQYDLSQIPQVHVTKPLPVYKTITPNLQIFR